MYPYHLDVAIRYEAAQARAAELRGAWRGAWHEADLKPVRDPSLAPATQFRFVHAVREATGRRLIGLGNRLLPAKAEPCA